MVTVTRVTVLTTANNVKWLGTNFLSAGQVRYLILELASEKFYSVHSKYMSSKGPGLQ